MRDLGGAFSGWQFTAPVIAKTVLATSIFATAVAANAFEVEFVRHQQTSDSGTVSTLITDGSDGQPPTTAVWDWDGTTLSSVGLYSATVHVGSTPSGPIILGDRITDLSIDTAAGTATAAAYDCLSGIFLFQFRVIVCGAYEIGPNFIDESEIIYGPGLLVTRNLNVNPANPPTPGDDFATGDPRDISAYDFGVVDTFESDEMTASSGTTPGDIIRIGNGIPIGDPAGGEALFFRVVHSVVDDAVDAKPTQTINIPVLDNDALTDNISALTLTTPTAGSAVVVGTLPGPKAGLSVDYTAPAMNGIVTFDYTVTDNSGNPLTATVTVNVTGVTAIDDGAFALPAFVVDAGSTIQLDVLANDFGLTDTPLTVSLVAPAATLGTPMITGSPGDPGAIRIEYTAGQTAGIDSIGYQVVDNSGDMDSATAFVEVTAPIIPVAVDDVATTFVDESIAIDVLANDTSLDDEPLIVDVTADPTNGTIGPIAGCTQQGGLCAVEYTPDAGFTGTDSFRYTVTDSTPEVSNEATVNVTVNVVPLAIDDTASTPANAPVSVDVLTNDLQLDFPPFTVTAVPNAATKGSAVVQADRIVYTPSGGSERTDAIQYTVTDANGKSSTAWLRVTIVPTQGGIAGVSSSLGPVGVGILAILAAFIRRRR